MFMSASSERRVRRWQEQRWILDSVIQSVGMEWDQPRLGYTLYPCGPDAIADFRTVGARVKKFADIDREFAAAARRRQAKADSFEKQGRLASARESYFIAALLWSAARWPIFETNARSTDYNSQMVRCYDQYAKYAGRPVERAEVPFGKGKNQTLPGYLHLPREPKRGEKFPCVISVDGMDGSKEIMCSIYGDKFLERGIANFIYDGPGQGECTIRGIPVTADNHMEAGDAVYRWLASHPHIDQDRIVLAGVSFGTYFGLQVAAALGDRLKGAAVSFVCHEPGMNALMNTSAPSFKMRFMYMSGYEDEDEFDQFCQGFTLAPVLPKITCPVLIQAGEEDELSPLEYTEDLVKKLKSPKQLVVYEGDRHAIGSGSTANYMGEHWFTMLADWCLDRVEGKRMKSERIFITATGQTERTAYNRK